MRLVPKNFFPAFCNCYIFFQANSLFHVTLQPVQGEAAPGGGEAGGGEGGQSGGVPHSPSTVGEEQRDTTGGSR